MVNCAEDNHEWEVEDVFTNDVIICVCEVCGEKAQFTKQEFN